MKILSLPNSKTKNIFKKATERNTPFAIIVKWPWFYKQFTGLTLGMIILVKHPDDIVLVCHELVHVEQFYREPFTFWINYLKEKRRVGYWKISYEREAYALGGKVKELLKL